MKLVLIFVLFSTASMRSELLQMQQTLEANISIEICQVIYTTIDDVKGARNLDNNQFGYLCDSNLTAGWYRWLLYGQDAIIPTSCTQERSCNTFGTMWLDLGQRMPAVGREVGGRGCISWESNCCWNHLASVKVRNCGTYYIYYLPPSPDICEAAFCLKTLS